MFARHCVPISLLLSAFVCLGGCDSNEKKPEPKSPPAASDDKKADVEAAKPEPTTPALVPGDPNEACAKILVVAYKGAQDAEETITRDKQAAKQRAEELRAKVVAGTDPSELAEQSDEPRTRGKQSAMGTYLKDKWPESFGELKEPVFALKIGEVSAPLDTPRGFVVAKRCPIEKVHTSHILVRYQGAKRADDDIKRSKDEAKKLATEIREKIVGGLDFAEAAKKYGEDGSSERGGDLGSVGRGMFAPPYETAAFALEAGAVSEVVETDFGFHIIKRM